MSLLAGIILDTSALRAAHGSLFVRHVLRTLVQKDRPIVVPATALVTAAGRQWLDPAEIDSASVTVTSLSQAIAPGVARIIARAGGTFPVDLAHGVYEQLATDKRYPILTADPKAYDALGLPLYLEPIADL